MDNANKKEDNAFTEKIAKKERLKLKAQGVSSETAWAGLGMFGMVGWSVAIPTLLGAALGIWLDKLYPESFSWALSLLIVGLIIGCMNAWYWVSKEDKETHIDKNNNNE